MEKNFHRKTDFFRRAQEGYPYLRNSEKKIVDYLRKRSHYRLDVSITEFANLLNISEATISRFCRSLGYRGFQDLKLSLATDVSRIDQFRNIPTDILETDPPEVINQKLSRTLSNAIIETQRSLEMDKVNAAVDEVAQARRVELYGVGGAHAVAIEANHLFLKAGIQCVAYSDGYMQTVTASMMGEDCAAIGISHTGLSMHVVNALKIAAQNGAITICITSNRESPLALVSKICLFTPARKRDMPLYGDFVEARVSQLYIIDLLYLGLIFKLGEISKSNLRASTDALKTYYNPIGWHRGLSKEP